MAKGPNDQRHLAVWEVEKLWMKRCDEGFPQNLSLRSRMMRKRRAYVAGMWGGL